ncbi:MAG: hypothetical protein ACLVKO_05565 [Dysgonomonas sp.]
MDDRQSEGQGVQNDAGQHAESIPIEDSGESVRSGISTDTGGQNTATSGGNSLENGSTPQQPRRNGSGNDNRNNTDKQPDRRDTRPSGDTTIVLNSNNFRIEDKNNIVPKGAISKIRANIKAIETLKKIESEDRQATNDEKHILSQYSGWGGFAEVLNKNRKYDENWKQKYGNFHDKIVELLTPEEYNTAVESTLNAFYTSGDIVSEMWKLAEHLGFKGGNILEPAIGTGNFFGLVPKHIAEKSALKAYEVDSITGRIAKYLYPDAKVNVTGYENSTDRDMDMIITNVPFGQTAPYDSANKDISKFSLHNYFIAKGIKQLAPNGIKKLERIIMRGVLYNLDTPIEGEKPVIMVSHSNDNVNYKIIKGLLLNKGNYKDLDLGLLSRSKYRQFVFCFAGQIDEDSYINCVETMIEKEYNNTKMR